MADVYPTTPFDTQAHQQNVDTPAPHAGTGEMSMLSKVKRKARNLKDKIKKATGSNTTSTEHVDNNEPDKREFDDVLAPDGKEVDDGAESYEDDEEEDDHSKPNDNQFKYEQLRSIGALEKQGDGSEVEVHGGLPVSTVASSPGTYWQSADDSAPISPYKSAGPPDALQATPTEYRNYAADDVVGGEEQTTSSTPNGLVENSISRDPGEEKNPLGSPSSSQVKTSSLSSYYEPAEPHSKHGISDTASASDIDVPYPEDLVKPNPSFGKSSSPTYDKIAVMNEDISADRKLGVGPSSEEHSGSGKGNLLETSVPESEELSGYHGSPSVQKEVDNLVYRPISDPEVGSSLTSPPGTLNGVVYEPDAIAQSSGTGQHLDNMTRQSQDLSGKAVESPRSGVGEVPLKGESDISPGGAYANETEYASSYGDQKPPFDTVREGALSSEQPADGGTATAGDSEHTAGDSEHESWGKWSADKSNNGKDAANTGLIEADRTNDNKSQQNSTDGWGSKLERNLQDDDVSKPGALEEVNKDAEEEFYDPNEVNDNQFQEGFALGSAEEGALSGTLTGSAIEKLQGLKETVSSSLGYSNHGDNGTGGEERPGFEGEERALSPSQQQQKGGFVQGLKETVTSSLGYGKAASDEASGNNDVFEREDKSKIDIDSRQHQSSEGTLQGLKNVVAAKLGYGTAEESPTLSKETESHEIPAEASSHEPLYAEGSEHGNAIKGGHVLSDVGDNAHREDEVSSQQQSGGVFQGAKDVVTSKLGYNSQPEETDRDISHTESASVPSPNSYTQKLFNTTAAARDYLSSKVGYGNSNEDKEKRDSAHEDDGEKFNISPSTHVDTASRPQF